MVIRDGMVTEKALIFGRPAPLVGILTVPDADRGVGALPAVILLNAGVLHRVGPNRIHVKLARRMAGSGFPVMRFDLSGIGDSIARTDSPSPIERAVGEVREAMDVIRAKTTVDRFILFGICSGADIAFHAARREERVVGAYMINGSFLQGDELEAIMPRLKASTAERYYRRAFINPKRWVRVITGKSDMRSIRKVLAAKVMRLLPLKEEAPDPLADSAGWDDLISRGVAVSLVYSEGSTALDIFRLALEHRLGPVVASNAVSVDVITDVDHVFTVLWSQELLIEMFCRWAAGTDKSWCP